MIPTITDAIDSILNEAVHQLEQRAEYHHENGENKKAYEIQKEISNILQSVINLKSIQ